MGNQPKRTIAPRRGEIYLVDFEPTRGAEMQKIRPSVIIQNDVGNRFSYTTIVAPITSKYRDKIYVDEVFIKAPEGGLDINSIVRVSQLRAVDKGRLIKKIGKLSATNMASVDRSLAISLGLTKL